MSDKNKTIHELIEKYNLNDFEKIKLFFSNEPFYINIKKDEEKGLYLLKYNLVKSDFNFKACCQARGIILEIDSNKIVCNPFEKFFNLNEKLAANIDWQTAEVQEKYDGSVIKMFYYANQWMIATNGCIDAGEARIASGLSFQTMFDEAKALTMLQLDQLDVNKTYLFELMHPSNPIVIEHERARLVHLATRDNETGDESEYKPIGVEQVTTFPLNTAKKCVDAAKRLGRGDKEGFVVVDCARNRVKIKSPTYVQLHHSNNAARSANAIEMAAILLTIGEADEIEAYTNDDKKIAKISRNIALIRKQIGRKADKLIELWFALNNDNDDNDKFYDKTKQFDSISKAIFNDRFKHQQLMEKQQTKTIPFRQFFTKSILNQFASEKPKLTTAKAMLEFIEFIHRRR